jgi:methylaspartate ammonia-lyase
MDKDMFLQLFKSLVRPHLEYGSTVWSVANQKRLFLSSSLFTDANTLVSSAKSLIMFSNASGRSFMYMVNSMTQLIEVMEQWTEDLDKKNSIDVIYLDFQKAFDTLPHKRLIHKLKGYGISGNLLLWIQDFLHERKQRVVLNGQSSSWTEDFYQLCCT